MSLTRRLRFALGVILLAQCTRASKAADPWPDHARAIVDSVYKAVASYRDRFSARDRDSLERFYAEDPDWKWVANGRIGIGSTLMIRSRLDRLTEFPYWHLAYVNDHVQPLAPGLAMMSAEYRMSFERKDKTRTFYDGALTQFWKHYPQGWKLVGGHSSSKVEDVP